MKKFRFRFNSILKLRKTREEEALKNLSAAQRAYQEELRKKQEILGHLDQSLNRRQSFGDATRSSKQSIGGNDYQLEQNFIIGLKQKIIRADQMIVRASRAVQKALHAYLIAKRQTKMMETLYEKEFNVYKKAFAKKQQSDQDDLSTMRARMEKLNSLPEDSHDTLEETA